MSAATQRPGIDIDHFRCRVLQDALAEALPAYWQRRAVTLQAVGTEPAAAAALACRRHAWLLEREGIPGHMLHELLLALEETTTQEGVA